MDITATDGANFSYAHAHVTSMEQQALLIGGLYASLLGAGGHE